MTVAAGGGLSPVLFRLRVKAVVVAFVWFIVKERTSQIRQLLAWAMTDLTLKVRRRRGRRCGVWSTDERPFVWADRCRAGILIGLRFG